jgi:hypothetical protein
VCAGFVAHWLPTESPRVRVAAARPVGDCVLLWLTFPFTADGGADVVYSRSRKLVVCEFTGGERG